jgi:hypothetical protein
MCIRDSQNRDLVLLGIKYEAARLGGLDETYLAAIAGQIREEAGEGWEKDPMVLRGRNAVREERGLARLGEPSGTSGQQPPARRSLWDRLRGR